MCSSSWCWRATERCLVVWRAMATAASVRTPLLTCHHALHHIGQGTLRCALLVPSLVARCCCECDGHCDADDSRSSLVPQHAHDRVMTDG